MYPTSGRTKHQKGMNSHATDRAFYVVIFLMFLTIHKHLFKEHSTIRAQLVSITSLTCLITVKIIISYSTYWSSCSGYRQSHRQMMPAAGHYLHQTPSHCPSHHLVSSAPPLTVINNIQVYQ